MCNLYSMTKPHDAVRRFFTRGWPEDRSGNQSPLPAIFPDMAAPIVRNTEDGRQLIMARWGMPTPAKYLADRKVDRGVTNIRQVTSPHWRPWLGADHRCVVPFTSFSENESRPDGSRAPVWFALDETRPLAFFAGLWTRWTSVRKLKEGEVNADLFGFLTAEPNAVVGAVHPKAMPVILTSEAEVEHWLTAPTAEALDLQRPLPEDALQVVACGEKQDP